MKGLIGTMIISLVIGILVLGAMPVKADENDLDIDIIPDEQEVEGGLQWNELVQHYCV